MMLYGHSAYGPLPRAIDEHHSYWMSPHRTGMHLLQTTIVHTCAVPLICGTPSIQILFETWFLFSAEPWSKNQPSVKHAGKNRKLL